MVRREDSRHYLAEGCASIGEFGETLGYSASETRMLARAGKAVRLRPSLKTLLMKGRLSLEGASILERVLADPLVAAAFPLPQWVYFAKTESARAFRDRVKKRLEEIRSQGPVQELTVHLSDRGLRDFDRARDLLSDKAKRDVSDSETVERLSDYYLEREDPDRIAPGTRRVGDTSQNRSRHVPEAVKRALRERANAKCEVPSGTVPRAIPAGSPSRCATEGRCSGGRGVEARKRDRHRLISGPIPSPQGSPGGP